MRPVVRRANPDDSAAIAHVHMFSRKEAMPWLPELHSKAETLWWIEHIVLPNQEVWVVEVDGDIVGVAAIAGQVLEQLYVLPTYQGQGIGSILLDKAIGISGGALKLWTFQRNTLARSFYERRGFTAIQFTDGSDNEECEPDVLYQLERPLPE